MRALFHRSGHKSRGSKPIHSKHVLIGVAVLVAIGLLPFALRLHAWAKSTLHYAEAGRVACAEPINPTYLKRCNVTADGPACTHETQTRLMSYHLEVELKCIQNRPRKPMVIEWVSDTPEPPSVKPDTVNEVQVAEVG